jgi:large subunit ribosomal protein L24
MKEEQQRVSKKIRKGDKVLITSGNYKGQSGTVLSCAGEKVVVQGINVRTRHMKGRGEQKGQKITIEKPVHISNMRPCGADNKPLKLKVRLDEQGARQLYYNKDGGAPVVYREIKKQAK